MAHVVLFYASADRSAIERVSAALREGGHYASLEASVWNAIPKAVWGEDHPEVPDADFAVICLSRAAEWDVAIVHAANDPQLSSQLRGGRVDGILLARLDDVQPPYLLAQLANVDLFPDDQAFTRGITRLMQAMEAHRRIYPMRGYAGGASARTAASNESSRSQRRRPREVPERFQVALSFAGVEREFVRAIAEAVDVRLGPSSVFFDEWYEFYIGGHDADVKLQRIYGTGCELAVVCVSATYGTKVWTMAEHEAIRSRLMQARAEEDPRQRDRVFPIRVGDGNVDGIPFTAIVPDVRRRTPEQVAELIADRLQFVMGPTQPAASVSTSQASGAGTALPAPRTPPPRIATPTPAYINAKVQALSEELERARERKQALRDAGIATDEVDGEILQLRRQLRDGGQLRAGDSLGDGRYLLVKQVGRGGFAMVWEAFDRSERRRVAIKVLHQHLASDSQRRERFFRGARVMMELKHRAVVRVLDPRGEDDSFCYFVMELVPGGNLREVVLDKLVKRDMVLPLILQVGEALAEAHGKQLVHRDIKPANILLDERGNAKLTDFDLVGAHDTTGGTRTGALGTVVYAAPECLDKPQDATARADVFGLGMSAIFCLSGRDLTMATFRNPPRMIAMLDCSESVRHVLAQAVEWAPEDRFADAGAMVDALRDAMGGMAPPAPIVIIPASALLRTNDYEAVADVRDRPVWAVASGRDSYGLWAAFEVNGVQQRMRWIPPGMFLMGSPETEAGRYHDEGPQHEVTLTRGYWLGETPVTQALWLAVTGENPSDFVSDDRPVKHVSWDDCHEFIRRLNERLDGLETRLPTEAEWERACRAGTTAATWVGDLTLRGEHEAPELDAIAWYGGNSGVDFELENGSHSSRWPETQHPRAQDSTHPVGRKSTHPVGRKSTHPVGRKSTHPVGRKAPNPFGLHDMLGNVWEWCVDDKRRYETGPLTDPVGDRQASFRVSRGGSWCSRARIVRATYRNAFSRNYRDEDLGFRLAGDHASAASKLEGEPRSGDQGRGAGRDTPQGTLPSAPPLPGPTPEVYEAARIVVGGGR